MSPTPSRLSRSRPIRRPAARTASIAASTFLLFAAGAGVAPAAAGEPTGDRLAPARTLRLDNGLTFVLRPDPDRPVVAVQMYYRVGARNEPAGSTGIAHYIEHMLFRGTTHFGLADVTGVIERAGGEWHGYTWIDGTTYFEAAPKALLPTLLRLEAERMTSARMAATEVEPERGAIVQEYRGYQIDPRSDLADQVAATLFLEHPYRNNTMGWESDLEGITHADLEDFYRRWYGPRNAVLAIAGDFDPDDAARRVRDLFGPIPAGGDDPRLRTVEPEPRGQRRVEMLRRGAGPALMVSFPAPAATRARSFAALLVLDAALAHAKGLSFYRHSDDLTTGTPADPASRLAVLTREDGPAAAIGTALVPTVYPYHYSVYARPAPGHGLDEVETRLFAAISEAAATLSEDEVASARRRIAAADDLETDGLVEMTHEMAFWTALGGLEARAAIRREVETVSLDEVRAAALTLVPERSVVGRLIPGPTVASVRPGAGLPPGSIVAPGPDRPEPRSEPTSSSASPARASTTSVATFDLPGHGRVIVDARPGQRTFVLRLALVPRDPAPGDAATTARLRGAAAGLDEDSTTRALLIAAGATVGVTGPDEGPLAERGTLRIDVSGPDRFLPGASALLGPALGRALARPALPPPAPSDDPADRAVQILANAVNDTEPRRTDSSASGDRPLAFMAAVVSPLDAADVRKAVGTIAAAVSAATTQALREGGRPRVARAGAAPAAPAGETPFVPGRRKAAIADVPQGRLLIALPGVPDPAAQEAVAWLLHHNYSGVLGVRAIAELGLVYGMESESLDGRRPLVYVTMGADPDRLSGLDTALEAVLDAATDSLSEQQVAAYRSFAAGVVTVRLADPDRAVRLWTAALLRGEDHRGPERRAARAAELTRDDVVAAARRMLDPARRLIVTVGRGTPSGEPAGSR